MTHSALEEADAVGGVHPTAVVDPLAELDATVVVGAFAVVGPRVRAARGVIIGPHTVIDGRVELGERVVISPFACVGQPAQLRGTDGAGPEGGVRIGAGSAVREYATVHAGSGDGWTVLGEDVLLMVRGHVAHDCRVGDRVVLANNTTLAGHVEVGDDATFGGFVGVHQFVRVGRWAFLAAGAMVERDVPPFCRVAGDRARLCGINLVGVRRAGLERARAAALRAAYRSLFREGVPLAQALLDAPQAGAESMEVQELFRFVATSERGICR